jgi:hypothetical protein
MLISCNFKVDEKVPINAMEIGKLNNGQLIYSCCDSRKDKCEFFKLIKKDCGELMICCFMTKCNNVEQEIENES